MAANFAEIGSVGKLEAYFQNKIRFFKTSVKCQQRKLKNYFLTRYKL